MKKHFAKAKGGGFNYNFGKIKSLDDNKKLKL
jgi:hypothetical protein